MVALRPLGEGSLELVCAWLALRAPCTSTVRLTSTSSVESSSRPKPAVVTRYGLVWFRNVARYERQEFERVELMRASVIGGVCDNVVSDGEFLQRERSPRDIARNKPSAVFLGEWVPHPGTEAGMFLGENLGNIVVGDEPPGDEFSQDVVTGLGK